MAHEPESPKLAEELAKLEDECRKAALGIADARSVRETVALAEVDVPHHLREIARLRVPTLQRMGRLRDKRVEEVVKNQLSSIMLEQNELVASREFDRIKAVDWHVLRAEYPDLYGKALREANLILERKRKRER
jgi:hypothetical protein